jgi:hypothetical protein
MRVFLLVDSVSASSFFHFVSLSWRLCSFVAWTLQSRDSFESEGSDRDSDQGGGAVGGTSQRDVPVGYKEVHRHRGRAVVWEIVKRRLAMTDGTTVLGPRRAALVVVSVVISR